MMKLTEPMPVPFTGVDGDAPAAPATDAPATAPTQPRRRRWWIAGVAGVAILAIGAVGYTQLRGPVNAPTPSSPAERDIAWQTVRPIRQTIRKTIEQPGHLEGYEHTPMYVKLPGFVKEWKTDMGAWVGKDAILAELSVPEEVEELKRREAVCVLSEAQVTASEKALEAAIADEAKAEAQLRQAKATKERSEANVARWKAEFRRNELAREKAAASQNDYNVALESLRTSEAGLLETKAGIDSATAAVASAKAARVKSEAAVAVAQAQVSVAKADAGRQREWLKYATVRAPFAGVISERHVENGQYVMPPTSGTPQLPLFVVERTDILRTFVDVPESEAALIADNMPVVVRVQSKNDVEIPARVSRLSWASTRTRGLCACKSILPTPMARSVPARSPSSDL